MHRLKSSQRERVCEFRTLTQTGEKTAISTLAAFEWNLDLALDNYFANPDIYFRDKQTPPPPPHSMPPHSMADRKKLEALYNRYKESSDPAKIGMDGVIKLLADLNLDPTSRLVLILAWKFKAAAQCEFTKQEFMNGMTDLGYN